MDRTYRAAKTARHDGKLYEVGKVYTLPAEIGDAVKALVPQVGVLQLSDLERCQLNAVLNKALTRQTFDPMHSAWESLNDVLKRGR